MNVVRAILQVTGALAITALLGLACILAYGFHDTVNVNQATSNQIRSVLNQASLSDRTQYSVISSYEQRDGFLPDHVVWYCVELSEFAIDTLAVKYWKPGPERNPVFSHALDLAAGMAEQSGCVSDRSMVNSPDATLRFLSLQADDHFPTAAKIFVYNAASRRLLYIDFET
jgi:hypothetical protein